jgi:hypothetical protein
MYLPSAVARQPEINAAISEIVRLLAPDVVHIRYDIDRDWSGDWAIFFRVLLSDEFLVLPSDEASTARLRKVASQVVRLLDERLDFPSIGPIPYHNFRSVSEQAVLQEPAWV